jgi:hypothetical protein
MLATYEGLNGVCQRQSRDTGLWLTPAHCDTSLNPHQTARHRGSDEIDSGLLVWQWLSELWLGTEVISRHCFTLKDDELTVAAAAFFTCKIDHPFHLNGERTPAMRTVHASQSTALNNL